MRYRTDSTWLRTGAGGRIVLAGSPLRLFRLSAAGGRLADRIERGGSVEQSTLTERLVEAGAVHPAPHEEVATWTRDDVTIVTPQFDGAEAGRKVPGTFRPCRDRVTVDDGSVPPIQGATIRLETNRGPAAARNAGRRLVDTELIAFVDADVQLGGADQDGASWLDALLPHFDDPAVGLVAPRVLGGRRTSLDLGDEAARIRVGTRVSYVPAAAIVVRAAAFDDVGGFDEGLRFGEDVDFVWRLDAAGWSCRYEPESSVWHTPRPSLPDRLRQQVGYGSSAAPLSLRHPDGLAPFRSGLWIAAAWMLGAIVHPLVGVLCAMGGATTVARRLASLPVSAALRVATQAQVAAGLQLAAAIRRAWWPIFVVLALVSRRARRVALAAALVDPGAVPTDLAYGWGLWRGAWKLRTWKPIVPAVSGGLSAWGPARRPRSGRSREPAESPAAADR